MGLINEHSSRGRCEESAISGDIRTMSQIRIQLILNVYQRLVRFFLASHRDVAAFFGLSALMALY